MKDESNFEVKSGNIPRRDFLKDTILASGIAAIFPFSLNGQNKMMNKYGLYEKPSARDKNNVERYLRMESGCVFELA